MNMHVYFCNVFVIIMITLKHFGQAVRPVIIEKIVDEVKPIDGTAILNCTVALFANSPMLVEWWRMRDNQLISQGTRISDALNPDVQKDVPKFHILEFKGRTHFIPDKGLSNVQTFSLFVKRLTNEDAGLYRCRINIQGTPQLSPAVYGRIIVPREPFITPSSITPNQVVEEGSRLRLDCSADAEPEPRISWTRANGGPINIGLGVNNPQRVYNATVIIPIVTREDRGVYRCHANNNVGQGAIYDVRVDVQYAPSVRVARKNAKYGQMPDNNAEIAFECLTEGYPDPEVTFYRGNVSTPAEANSQPPLSDDSYQFIERIRSQGAVGTRIDAIFYVLKMFNIRSETFGWYTCKASNDMGDDFAHFEFFRQDICQGPLCTWSNKQDENKGSGLLLKSYYCVTLSLQLLVYFVVCLWSYSGVL